MLKWLILVPPLLFAIVFGLFFWGMGRENPSELPSVFVGQKAPPLPPTGLEEAGIPLLVPEDLRAGEVVLVNFWATWCPPCRAEHPTLMELAAQGIGIAGVNIMDDDDKAKEYLAREGNPFFAVATDPKGRFRLEWGVTAPPETFIVGPDGTILFRFVGPLVGSDYEQRFLPALQKALTGAP